MRAVSMPRLHNERPFDYFCPICGAELAESNYETVDAAYSCPACSTKQRASRTKARPR